MIYKWIYKTPPEYDDILMNSDGENLTGLKFINKKELEKPILECKEISIFKETCKWLDIYFTGKNPHFTPKIKVNDLTTFRKEVIDIIKKIPYGSTITYNEIAGIIAKKRGLKKMSAQAVGASVGWNPICIIIPCHRVIGTNNNITGYNGGLKNKISLLANEKQDINKFYLPKGVSNEKM